MKITAILCVRNEELYLDVTLAHLADCGIRLAIIDNDSTDRTPQICEKFRAQIVYRSRLPYRGVFSLTEQLAAKAEAFRRIESDWFIHQDADEILESPRADESLREGIERVAAAGWNTINFDEFVFVPPMGEDTAERRDFYRELLHYYFFEPEPGRLMRAWKNMPDILQVGGGHKLDGPGICRCPENFVLRHYPTLNLDHARQKYPPRRFAPEDLAKGWHYNRLNIRADTLAFPSKEQLQTLSAADDKNFDRMQAWRRHFWNE